MSTPEKISSVYNNIDNLQSFLKNEEEHNFNRIKRLIGVNNDFQLPNPIVVPVKNNETFTLTINKVSYLFNKLWLIHDNNTIIDSIHIADRRVYYLAEICRMIEDKLNEKYLKTETNMKKKNFVLDEIILSNNDDPTEEMCNHVFSDDEEHYYHGAFYDGIAVVERDADDKDAPQKLILTYPTMDMVNGDDKLFLSVLDYKGMDEDEEINFFDIALTFAHIVNPTEIGF